MSAFEPLVWTSPFNTIKPDSVIIEKQLPLAIMCEKKSTKATTKTKIEFLMDCRVLHHRPVFMKNWVSDI